jgi:small subunit ribosomal protein S2
MEKITLQALLEAGCHFGHKSERWNPKAASFIYTQKDGVHIIDLAKTKLGLEEAIRFVTKTMADGGEIIFAATKRQAKGVVREAAEMCGAPYLVERWIGGFLTNWDHIQKNIEKINRLSTEQTEGAWKKFPKHEQLKLAHYLGRLKVFYGGVLKLTNLPAALFVVDIRKERSAVLEAKRCGIPVVAIVDTNADPEDVDYPIPANDDAVGSIQLIAQTIARAYLAGKKEQSETAATVEGPEHAKEEEKKEKTESDEPKKEERKPVKRVAKTATKGLKSGKTKVSKET